MIDVYEIIQKAKQARATDVHLSVGNPPVLRIDGFLSRMQGYPAVNAEDILGFVDSILHSRTKVKEKMEIDFSSDSRT